MHDAAKELGAGHGDQGLQLQRDAQRLLEQTNSGDSGSGDSEGKDQSPQQSPKDSSSSKGKQMRQDAEVPKDGSGHADDFRRRVLDGLSKQARGRLSDAVRRYAEGLLQ